MALLILTGCNRHQEQPYSSYFYQGARPYVAVEEMACPDKSEVSIQSASVITQAVFERLQQKDRIEIAKRGEEFQVKMQLVQLQQAAHSTSELSMQIHLEILDLRRESPKIILQEVLSSNPLFSSEDLIKIDWKDPAFRMSPLGLAHLKLSREIATRIEDYILLATKGRI